MTTEYTLTLLDARRVQNFIFSSNELKQNLGASELVEQATHQWVYDKLPSPNSARGPDLDAFDASTIEGNNLQVEVLFAGGGNVGLLFASDATARAFAREYTLRVMERAPGLDVAVAHVAVVWDDPGALSRAWDRLHAEVMPMRKEGHTTAQAVAGLGVTAQCAYTRKPAVDESDGVLISAEVKAKLDYVPDANSRLHHALALARLKFPYDFEQLGGEQGRADYIAVVHADGNGMGKRIQRYARADDNREMANRLRGFSQAVNRRGLEAMKAVRDLLVARIEYDSNGKPHIKDALGKAESVRLKKDFLPMRPVVFGGDDVTFVCDGRLGLALAAKFLEAFDDEDLPDGYPGFACAGIAVVHTHYPFAQAYALAADLCDAAKKEAHALARDEKSGVSMMHWHYAVSGLTGEWRQIHERQYRSAGKGDLTTRPLAVAAMNASPTAWRTWDAFVRIASEFRQREWTARRSKMKALRAALRQGTEATKQFTHLHGPLPTVVGLGSNVQSEGWHGTRCAYFDALEADDLFVYME